MVTVQLRDIEDYLYECETVIDKANRVAHGVNQGRTVHKDKNYYYKVFHKDYCRRENFIRGKKYNRKPTWINRSKYIRFLLDRWLSYVWVWW